MTTAPDTDEAQDRGPNKFPLLSKKRVRRLGLLAGFLILSIVGFIDLGGQGVWIGLGPYVLLVIVETARSSSALERVKKRLENAQRCACMFTGAPGITADQVTGLWKGCRVQVGSSAQGVRIGVPLARLPATFVAEPRSAKCEEHRARTGDEAFDQALCVGSDDGVWRGVLTAEARALLLALSRRVRTSSHDRALDVELPDGDAGELEAVLDLAVAFAAAVPPLSNDEPLARVFALATAEPVGAVREGHYRWLAAQGWNTLQVHRAAAADPDPAIAAWGSSQLAPSDGVFR